MRTVPGDTWVLFWEFSSGRKPDIRERGSHLTACGRGDWEGELVGTE